MTDEISQKVETSVEGAVLVVRINRPRVRNAIDEETAHAIEAAMDMLDARDDLAVGILTGTGTAFCAGMDLTAFVAGERPSTERRGFGGLVEHPPAKPLIAAVNGPAIAGGFELALACDLLIAAESAQFGLPEVKRGLVAAAGGLLRLPTRIPYHAAMELALTGRYISAREAAELGLVTRVVADGETLDAALELAGVIAENSPLALAATKRTIVEAAGWAPEDAFARGREISEKVRASDDAQEGARAFLERRAPKWTGR